MKNIATAIALTCLSSSTMAQVSVIEKPVVCAPVMSIVAELEREYGETPMIIAPQKHGKSNMVFFANADKKTWTLVEMDQKTGCIVGSGDDFHAFKAGRGA